MRGFVTIFICMSIAFIGLNIIKQSNNKDSFTNNINERTNKLNNISDKHIK